MYDCFKGHSSIGSGVIFDLVLGWVILIQHNFEILLSSFYLHSECDLSYNKSLFSLLKSKAKNNLGQVRIIRSLFATAKLIWYDICSTRIFSKTD